MTVAGSTMFIPVHDPEEALPFYRHVLGLEVRNDVKQGQFRWVTVGAPGQHLDAVLSPPHGGRPQPDGDALLETVTKGSIQAAIFSAIDLDGTFERVRASDCAEVLQDPRRSRGGPRPRGARPVGELDPDRTSTIRRSGDSPCRFDRHSQDEGEP